MKLVSCLFLFLILWSCSSSISFNHVLWIEGAAAAELGNDAKLEVTLDQADACSQLYYKEFRQFIAREKQIQKRYDRKGALVQQREIISDYYVISLPSHPEEALEFRDTISVDGKELPRDPRRLKQLFDSHTTDLESEIQRINKESTRYYLANQGLGDLAGTWYQYASPEHRGAIACQLLPGQASNGESNSVVEFQEAPSKTLIHFKDLMGRRTPIPAMGKYYLADPGGRLVKVDITISWGGKHPYPLGRWIKEFEPGPEGVMVPAHFSTVLYQGHQGKHFLETESSYSNFRRFAAEVKLMPAEPLEGQK